MKTSGLDCQNIQFSKNPHSTTWIRGILKTCLVVFIPKFLGVKGTIPLRSPPWYPRTIQHKGSASITISRLLSCWNFWAKTFSLPWPITVISACLTEASGFNFFFPQKQSSHSVKIISPSWKTLCIFYSISWIYVFVIPSFCRCYRLGISSWLGDEAGSHPSRRLLPGLCWGSEGQCLCKCSKAPRCVLLPSTADLCRRSS